MYGNAASLSRSEIAIASQVCKAKSPPNAPRERKRAIEHGIGRMDDIRALAIFAQIR